MVEEMKIRNRPGIRAFLPRLISGKRNQRVTLTR
jgi:hypothetical protein